jgi:hypothetical protein
MYDPANFSLLDMTNCSAALRRSGRGAPNMETVANRTVGYLHEHLVNSQTGASACALVRFFKTHPFQALEPDLQTFALQMLGNVAPPPSTKCLTLLATAGDEPAWNARRQSIGHRAVPLPSDDIVQRFPMVSQLIHQFGLDTPTVLEPDEKFLLDQAQTTYNVFHVYEAQGSPIIPAQSDFVIPYGIRSVLGFGGMLPDGDLFATILFSKVSISRESAEMFRPLALSVKVALLDVASEAVFA